MFRVCGFAAALKMICYILVVPHKSSMLHGMLQIEFLVSDILSRAVW